MSDQFALVPRALSDRFFSAVAAFYACDGVSWPPPVSWWQPDCHGMSFEESVLFRHIHAVGIPYRLFSMFEYVIVRGEGGGVCKLGTSDYIHTCNVLVGLSTGILLKPPLDRWVDACRICFCFACCNCRRVLTPWISCLLLGGGSGGIFIEGDRTG